MQPACGTDTLRNASVHRGQDLQKIYTDDLNKMLHGPTKLQPWSDRVHKRSGRRLYLTRNQIVFLLRTFYQLACKGQPASINHAISEKRAYRYRRIVMRCEQHNLSKGCVAANRRTQTLITRHFHKVRFRWCASHSSDQRKPFTLTAGYPVKRSNPQLQESGQE